jgi:hypothetical protein
MKLKVIYDINNLPSTAMLSITAEEMGYMLDTILENGNHNILGIVWYNPNNLTQSDFAELEAALSEFNDSLSFEVIE